MREGGDDVYPLLEGHVLDLVEDEREDDGRGEIEKEQDEVDDQGVFHHVPEIDVLQKRGKVRKAHPVAEEQRLQKIGRIVRVLEA